MAALDLFRTVTGELTGAERTAYADLIHQAQLDLLAARSEEARLRIIHNLVADLHASRGQRSRRPVRAQTP